MINLKNKPFKKIILFVFLFAAGLIIFLSARTSGGGEMSFGVTFSKPFAQFMGIDWKETYLAIFDDLGVRKIRLMSYWNEIEPSKGVYLFADLDWQIEIAANRGAEIIVVLGQKQPRWPECHIPDWAEKLSKGGRQKEANEFVKKVVERYKDKKNIVVWQVENEPYFHFGECPDMDKDFLDQEIALVRSLDNRPIMVTDSGELGYWYNAASRADILGTTLYRIVWNKNIGYIKYPIPVSFYRIKAEFVRRFTGVKKVIVAELQGEAWGSAMPSEMPLIEQYKSMDPEKFQAIVKYAKSTGFSESYFWGVEWWYWLKKVKGDGRMWQEAKKVFREEGG
jgi:hypothetical protein